MGYVGLGGGWLDGDDGGCQVEPLCSAPGVELVERTEATRGGGVALDRESASVWQEETVSFSPSPGDASW